MPKRSSIYVGYRVGRLTVIGRSDEVRQHERLWECRCDCGGTKHVIGSSLKRGATRSCGCLNNERRSERFTKMNTTHGMRFHPLHRVWGSMLSRCLNSQHQAYPNYGGRGITVCDRWQGPSGFPNFVSDMGPRPDGLTLDRINNDQGYEPGNCRWTTWKVQQSNRRPRRPEAERLCPVCARSLRGSLVKRHMTAAHPD
jgi:hypothetical protein